MKSNEKKKNGEIKNLDAIYNDIHCSNVIVLPDTIIIECDSAHSQYSSSTATCGKYTLSISNKEIEHISVRFQSSCSDITFDNIKKSYTCTLAPCGTMRYARDYVYISMLS
jgi:hypothetical protein